ncbi:hypothetical protein RFI_15871 [Reticulomyxa filosa]|uniref:Uncharacterized protein n=1 Tax=Reticulomyxa filosa TaxID=46433 RepID=X6N5P7_RETFI|nr:hypothetical protein RFI_15871 [Reticulomyxa filosa]|eukprot:ETO21331.1 hypothetical protein RFI_15871 [Reticulomyxa filosa]
MTDIRMRQIDDALEWHEARLFVANKHKNMKENIFQVLRLYLFVHMSSFTRLFFFGCLLQTMSKIQLLKEVIDNVDAVDNVILALKLIVGLSKEQLQEDGVDDDGNDSVSLAMRLIRAVVLFDMQMYVAEICYQ